MAPTDFDFGQAIAALKSGHKVSRRGWNGKGQYVYHVPANIYPAQTEVAKAEFGDEGVPYMAYLAIRTVNGSVVPWLASQTDLLSEDWFVTEN